MAWGGRNFPLSGHHLKEPPDTYRIDWTSAALIGSLVLVILFIALAFAFGFL